MFQYYPTEGVDHIGVEMELEPTQHYKGCLANSANGRASFHPSTNQNQATPPSLPVINNTREVIHVTLNVIPQQRYYVNLSKYTSQYNTIILF